MLTFIKIHDNTTRYF